MCCPPRWSSQATSRAIAVVPCYRSRRRSGCGLSLPSGNRCSTMARPTGRGAPSAGFRWYQQAGAGVDLDDRAALLVERTRDVFRHQVDRRRCRGRRRGRPASAASATSGWTRSVTSMATLPLRWISTVVPAGGTDAGVEALACEVELDGVGSRRTGLSGKSSSSPRRGSVLSWLSTSSPMVEWPSPVTEAVSPRAAGDDATADHQQAVFESRVRSARPSRRCLPSRATAKAASTSCACREFGEHAAAVVAVRGLDDDRQADVLGRLPGVFGAVHGPSFRHRHAAGIAAETW